VVFLLGRWGVVSSECQLFCRALFVMSRSVSTFMVTTTFRCQPIANSTVSGSSTQGFLPGTFVH